MLERKKNKEMSNILLGGLTLRPATIEDARIIYRLLEAYDYALFGEPDFTPGDVQNMLTRPKINLVEDSLLAFDEAGRLVGMLMLEQNMDAKFSVMMRLLPGYEKLHLGAYLLKHAESLARQRMTRAEPGVRVTLETWATAQDLATCQIIEQVGFREIRRFWRMEIEMDSVQPAPQWPEGIELRPFILERDARSVFDMIETAFSDHWGFVPHRFDEWQHWMFERESFDPTLWFLAYEGEQIAGGSLCVREEAYGWVDTLGILRPWRRKGLGLALLQHSFGEFYRRGQRRVGLGVDSESLTGATRLYERAGMHKVREGVSFEKELRAGVELSTRTLPV